MQRQRGVLARQKMWVSGSPQLARLLAKLEKGSRRANEEGLLLAVAVAAAEKAAAATSLAVSLSPLSLSLLRCQLFVCVCVSPADYFLVGEKMRERAGGSPVWLGCMSSLFPIRSDFPCECRVLRRSLALAPAAGIATGRRDEQRIMLRPV